MVDIDKVIPEIVSRLKVLNPDKIILFGSYAYGTPTEDSDIDLFILKDELDLDEIRKFQRKAKKSVRDLVSKYKIGFDILSAPTKEVLEREDYFYKIDLLQNGVVLYE